MRFADWARGLASVVLAFSPSCESQTQPKPVHSTSYRLLLDSEIQVYVDTQTLDVGLYEGILRFNPVSAPSSGQTVRVLARIRAPAEVPQPLGADPPIATQTIRRSPSSEPHWILAPPTKAESYEEYPFEFGRYVLDEAGKIREVKIRVYATEELSFTHTHYNLSTSHGGTNTDDATTKGKLRFINCIEDQAWVALEWTTADGPQRAGIVEIAVAADTAKPRIDVGPQRLQTVEGVPMDWVGQVQVSSYCWQWIDWNLTSDVPWISFNPSTGIHPSGTDIPEKAEMWVDSTNLVPGTYPAVVSGTASSGGRQDSATVSLEVLKAGMTWVRPAPDEVIAGQEFNVRFSAIEDRPLRGPAVEIFPSNRVIFLSDSLKQIEPVFRPEYPIVGNEFSIPIRLVTCQETDVVLRPVLHSEYREPIAGASTQRVTIRPSETLLPVVVPQVLYFDLESRGDSSPQTLRISIACRDRGGELELRSDQPWIRISELSE